MEEIIRYLGNEIQNLCYTILNQEPSNSDPVIRKRLSQLPPFIFKLKLWFPIPSVIQLRVRVFSLVINPNGMVDRDGQKVLTIMTVNMNTVG